MAFPQWMLVKSSWRHISIWCLLMMIPGWCSRLQFVSFLQRLLGCIWFLFSQLLDMVLVIFVYAESSAPTTTFTQGGHHYSSETPSCVHFPQCHPQWWQWTLSSHRGCLASCTGTQGWDLYKMTLRCAPALGLWSLWCAHVFSLGHLACTSQTHEVSLHAKNIMD
jgi:hypothetical protein